MPKGWVSWAPNWPKPAQKIKVSFQLACFFLAFAILLHATLSDSVINRGLLNNAGGNGSGGVNEAWRCVGEEMEAAAEAHRIWGITLSEQIAKPLRVSLHCVETWKKPQKYVDKCMNKLYRRNYSARNRKKFTMKRRNCYSYILWKIIQVSRNTTLYVWRLTIPKKL